MRAKCKRITAGSTRCQILRELMLNSSRRPCSLEHQTAISPRRTWHSSTTRLDWNLEPDVILHWACNLRWRSKNNELGAGVASVEAYLKASEESLAQMESNVKMKRCYTLIFNAGQSLVENLTANQFLLLVHNEKTGVAECFMEFSEQVRTNTVRDKVAELGAFCINVATFQKNDGNFSAASALNRVRDVVKSDGFVEVVRGTCNAKLMKKADELATIEAEKRRQTAGKEFDEKTAAAIKLSLEETKESMSQVQENMATVKETVVEQAQMASATKDGLSRLAGITEEVKETVVEHGKGQTYTIRRLNKERDELNAEVHLQKDEIIRLQEKHRMDLKQKDAQHRVIVKEKDSQHQAIIKEKDTAIKEKDDYIRTLMQDVRAANSHVTALLVTLAKRKKPDQ
uniref:Uncharacterized protein n=1 Tax=Cryptomonas curvata TaxID=233186 RepID=A0A7S0M054_9CRYP|mmetsp:Transcript_18476/g.39004  ORF Transcript_18476/g.39004 Transcript_18476/m.39004 type:complete len:400 (+) Transcript_18476:48-1247(+)